MSRRRKSGVDLAFILVFLEAVFMLPTLGLALLLTALALGTRQRLYVLAGLAGGGLLLFVLSLDDLRTAHAQVFHGKDLTTLAAWLRLWLALLPLAPVMALVSVLVLERLRPRYQPPAPAVAAPPPAAPPSEALNMPLPYTRETQELAPGSGTPALTPQAAANLLAPPSGPPVPYTGKTQNLRLVIETYLQGPPTPPAPDPLLLLERIFPGLRPGQTTGRFMWVLVRTVLLVGALALMPYPILAHPHWAIFAVPWALLLGFCCLCLFLI